MIMGHHWRNMIISCCTPGGRTWKEGIGDTVTEFIISVLVKKKKEKVL